MKKGDISIGEIIWFWIVGIFKLLLLMILGIAKVTTWIAKLIELIITKIIKN